MSLLDRQFLEFNLCFVYRLIVASAPLLRFAIARAAGDLKVYYKKHLAEEVGHDDMLKDDLKRLGVERVPRYFEAAEIAGSQYYLIAHEHPVALLGYMHVLERNAVKPSVVDTLEQVHGVELKAMRHHAEHDPAHVSDLETQIKRLPNAQRSLVEWNALRVRQSLQRVLNARVE